MSLLETDLNDGFEGINITDPRTFVTAAAILILFGLMVGMGYYMIFMQFPNLTIDQKAAVVGLSITPGIVAGASPYIFQKWKDEGEFS